MLPPAILPNDLRVTSELPFNLSAGSVSVRAAAPVFTRWPIDRPRPKDTKGNKPLLDLNGQVTFGELAILATLVREGWEGRWIDNYPLPPTFRLAYWDDQLAKLPRDRANVPLPPDQSALYESICVRSGDPRGGGAWDLMAWRGDEVLFVEAKRRGSTDRIRPAQLTWLDAALQLRVPRECFLFVEWSAK